jgi:hypothetical protein
MTTLTIPRPVGATGPKLSVRCTAKQQYAVIQLVPNATKTYPGRYRAKVLFRSDNRHSVAVKVRQLGGWSYVFDNRSGAMLWEGSSSDWPSCESAMLNNEPLEV